MRREFSPELLNRCEAVIFNSLGKDDLRGIVKLEMSNLEERVKDRGFKIRVRDEVLDYLAEIGFDGVYGARPLKRVIQREVERQLAKMILSSEVGEGDIVDVEIDENDRVKLSVVVGAAVGGVLD
jgi:ATP-dependent Clp protease ATP-binding subunit ClpB